MLSELADADVLQAIRWSFESAARRTRADYDDATGHDAAWAGITRWVILRDRLDRVFSCGRYATPNGASADAGLDVVYASLSEEEITTLPQVAPGAVFRDDLLGSPGWSTGQVRWLLASAEFGGIDDIRWNRRSPLKQRVANQPNPDNDQASIFDELDDPWAVQLREALVRADTLDVPTLVVTHTQDIYTDDRELYIGLPSMEDSDRAWAWKHDLMSSTPGGAAGVRRVVIEPDGPRQVPDAVVRLRQPAAGTGTNGSSTHNDTASRSTEER